MKRGQVVIRKKITGHTHCQIGAVVGTETREGSWKFLQVQWICKDAEPVPIEDRTEWVRHDEVIFINPFDELKRIQDAMMLSSALISKNFEKVLKKQYGYE